MPTESELWCLKDLWSAMNDPSIGIDSLEPRVFTVPQFQRRLVWPETKKEALIQSILEGYPIGCLLLYRHPLKKTIEIPGGQSIEAEEYGIVDGLQRTDTIVSHLRNTLIQIAPEMLMGLNFDAMHSGLEEQAGQQLLAERVLEVMLNWMKERQSPSDAGYSPTPLIKRLFEDVLGKGPDAAAFIQLDQVVKALLDHVKDRVDISEQKIPVLVYTGDKADLPEIFERINTQGTALSKYEVFAATWSYVHVSLDGNYAKEVEEQIELRANKLTDAGFTLADADHVTLFDYLDGLSQVIGKKFPMLFSSDKAEAGELSVAFPLATLIHGFSLSDMADLDRIFPVENGKVSVSRFEEVLRAALDVVGSALGHRLAFSFDGEGGGIDHAEYQMISLVGAASAALFDPNKGLAERHDMKEKKKTITVLKKTIPQHFLYDAVRRRWRGSLYSYATEDCWSLTRTVDLKVSPTKQNTATESRVILAPVSALLMRNAMQALGEEQIGKRSTSRQNVSAVERMILRLIFSKLVSVEDQVKYKFHIDHLIPVAMILGSNPTSKGSKSVIKPLMSNAERNSGGWPISALGNLSVLPSKVNLKKSAMALGDFMRKSPSGEFVQNATKDLSADEVAFVEQKAVSIPIDRFAPTDGKMSRINFEATVRDHWNEMSELLIKSVEAT